ncbi:MAG: 5'/3'-nucleotidase SurE [Bacteroidales bacterium]|jgi:5'-nucleotidase|nr:5'/3'-nucleotidase SurE [Bacteroidales bacterium]
MNTEKSSTILLSNDDGVFSEGIKALINAMRPLGNIFVVAPDGGRSGMGCSVTSQIPVRAQLIQSEPNLTVYTCTGTPVDCIKLALGNLMPQKPDLIVAGINHGSNESINVHYSGTMGIAIEGALNKIPSIGFSLCNYSPEADFSQAAQYANIISRKILKMNFPAGICLNVNIPDIQHIKGIKICRQSNGVWSEEFEQRTDPHGFAYYWLTGTMQYPEKEYIDTDKYALANGYVSIVPCKIDVTAHEQIETFSRLFL